MLRALVVKPQKMTVVVGAERSGKTNLADAIEFLADVYRHGLELAIARKGGYENIIHRKTRRSKRGLGFSVTARFEYDFPEVCPPANERTVKDRCSDSPYV